VIVITVPDIITEALAAGGIELETVWIITLYVKY
jgi:hypothetical protein